MVINTSGINTRSWSQAKEDANPDREQALSKALTLATHCRLSQPKPCKVHRASIRTETPIDFDTLTNHVAKPVQPSRWPRNAPELWSKTTPLNTPKTRVSRTKGQSSRRTAFVRDIAREVVGLAPYERRIIELLRNTQDKRARKLAKKRVRSIRHHALNLADIAGAALVLVGYSRKLSSVDPGVDYGVLSKLH
ncbi:unnamed protein product [Aspergillus oryzae]|nr:unnamed protein product [Aspergillus oryzae]GMF84338.1 unnamed protein product [Aspergillus oryzae]